MPNNSVFVSRYLAFLLLQQRFNRLRNRVARLRAR